ncbi:DNA packaging protein [Acinetobacter phage vB_AbaP_Alexa]|nr:DNA packaging protein [Acinetobacter phage vB_AbaP_Alexa]
MAVGTGTKGQIVNRTGLSDIFGVALNTIDAWVKKGCPVVQKGGGRGQEWKFNTADVGKWLRADAAAEAKGTKDASVDELNRRKAQASTELVELELAKAKAEVAPIDQVMRAVSRAFAEVRAGMRNIPGRTVSQLIGETDERRFKAVLLSEIDEVLKSLADASLLDDYGDEDAKEDADE